MCKLDNTIKDIRHTASSTSVATPLWHSLTLGAGMSDSGTTFGWLQDVLFMHMQGVDML